jgi:hypothetical protein
MRIVAQRLTDIDLKLHESAFFSALMAHREQAFTAGANNTPMSEQTLQAAREFGFLLSALLSALRTLRFYIKRATEGNPAAAAWYDASEKNETLTVKATRLLRDVNTHVQAHELLRRIKYDRDKKPALVGPYLAFHRNILLALQVFKTDSALVDYLDSKSIMEFASEALAEHVKLACEGHNRGYYKLTLPA